MEYSEFGYADLVEAASKATEPIAAKVALMGLFN
jgi:hypothetical protein